MRSNRRVPPSPEIPPDDDPRPSAAPAGSGAIAIIPARWGASRFPGKPLHPIAGKPLIQHVWERCGECQNLAAIAIATDDARIAAAAEAFGARAIMTRDDHPSGTDRIAEAAAHFPGARHIINVQGDEPLISPALIDRLAADLAADPDLPMITAANPISDPADVENPNIVKVVLNIRGEALYFSRSVIPYFRGNGLAPRYLRHQGIYGYARDFLLSFVRWGASPLESSEGLEQLRALENGARIRVVEVAADGSVGVDTPEQAAEAERLIAAAATAAAGKGGAA